MDKDNELWAYDEPHESGGNVQTTMTRRQAIDWMRRMYPRVSGRTDDALFEQWATVHWAYRITAPSGDAVDGQAV